MGAIIVCLVKGSVAKFGGSATEGHNGIKERLFCSANVVVNRGTNVVY